MRIVTFIVVLGVAGCGGPDRPRDTVAPSAVGTDTAIAPAPGPGASPALVVTERGIGPLEAGMSLSEASAALGTTLSTPPGTDAASCHYVTWRDAPSGVRVMVEGGRIARVDVDSAGVATAAGVRVGDDEDRVQRLYAGHVRVSPHKYVEGKYLTVTPARPADSAYRIVFEAEKGRIVRYRAGRRPPVEYVERCG